MEKQLEDEIGKSNLLRGHSHSPCFQILSISHVHLLEFCPRLDVRVGRGDTDTDTMRTLGLPEKNRTRCSIQISDKPQHAFSVILSQMLHGRYLYWKSIYLKFKLHCAKSGNPNTYLHIRVHMCIHVHTRLNLCVYMYAIVNSTP